MNWPYRKIPERRFQVGDFVVMNSPFAFEMGGVGIVEECEFRSGAWWCLVCVPQSGRSWIADRSMSHYVPREQVESARGLIE